MQYFNRFEYGYDVEVYYEKAVEILKKTYYWVTKEHLNPEWRFDIQKVKFDDYQYFQYHRQPDGTYAGEAMTVCYNGAEFIRRILEVNEQYVLDAVPVADVYEVPFYPVKLSTGWALEHYEFRLLKTGDYAVEIRVSNRTGGLKKCIFIPPSCFAQHDYADFLETYQTLVPSGIYQIATADLLADGQLKAFLGFTKMRPHPEVRVVGRETSVVCGKSYRFQGNRASRIKESILLESPDSMEDIWDDDIFLRKFDGGSAISYWGIMCRTSAGDDFEPWLDNYKTGIYFAGAELSDTARPPVDWEYHVIPEGTFVVAETTEDLYDEVFVRTLNVTIPEMGYRLFGSICEKRNPKNDRMELYFPVTKLVKIEKD